MAMMSGGDGATAQIMQEPPPTVAAGPVAPFVAKTYRMVDDPSTDAVISWGPANNSILVADPFAFARTLLPAYFEHCNFSSFVRQLNTYGFRKVDPDRWEFAHVAFLRGQTHLLHRVVRQRKAGGKRRHDGAGAGSAVMDEEGAAARQLVMEVVQLKREQKANEELLAAMCRRVHEIERRPKQTLAFLLKAAGDPQVLRRVLAGTGGRGSHGIGGGSRNSAEPEDRGQFKSARLLHDCDRRRLSCSGGEADGAAGSRFDGVQGGGGCGEDEFDLTGFLTNGGSEDTGFLTNGGSEDGRLMPPCTSHAESGY